MEKSKIQELYRSESLENWILNFLDRIPVLSFYSKTRGWPYVIAWCHRIAGLTLFAFLFLHIYRLWSLSPPGIHEPSMKIYGFFPTAVLAFALAIPLIFHALNGSRLILYENFGRRNDESMIRWVFGLSVIYLGILGVIILMGNQRISPFLFWLISVTIGLILGYVVAAHIRNRSHSFYWKFQRTTGGFLLFTLPAYFLFIYLNRFQGMEGNSHIVWTETGFIGAVRLLFFIAALYHGGYGVCSIIGDYLSSRFLRIGFSFLVSLVLLFLAWICIRMTLGF
jgi:succinate dehydrogenase hydrophobic anchor subunit